MNNKPTIREVAKLAGVAVGTVSNVLNESAFVRESTRSKVEAAMQQLGFRPDAIARSLIGRRSRRREVGTAPGRPRLTTVGYVSVDYTARVQAFPISGDRVTSHGIKKSLGGPAANVAVTAAGLGGRCSVNCELITALGGDADSEWALAELTSRGVRAVTIHPYRGGRLSRCIVLVDETGRRTIINEPFELGLRELTSHLGRPAMPDEHHCLHVEGYQVATVVRLLEKDPHPGLITSVHATGLPDDWHSIEGFARLLEIFDVVFLNRESAARILGCAQETPIVADKLDAAFRRVAPTRRARTLALTLGPDGAMIDPLGGHPARTPARPVPVVDTTGAGDAFVGCFLASWLNDRDPMTAGRLATRAGGVAVTFEGAQGPRITIDMVDDDAALPEGHVASGGSREPAEAV